MASADTEVSRRPRPLSPHLSIYRPIVTMVMSIMHRISEINGVIPKEPLITIDQRAIHLTQGEVTFSIEAASGNYLNGDGPNGNVPQAGALPEAEDGDLLS